MFGSGNSNTSVSDPLLPPSAVHSDLWFSCIPSSFCEYPFLERLALSFPAFLGVACILVFSLQYDTCNSTASTKWEDDSLWSTLLSKKYLVVHVHTSHRDLTLTILCSYTFGQKRSKTTFSRFFPSHCEYTHVPFLFFKLGCQIATPEYLYFCWLRRRWAEIKKHSFFFLFVCLGSTREKSCTWRKKFTCRFFRWKGLVWWSPLI